MTPEDRDRLRDALIPNFPGATAEAIEWLITLLARLENCERAVAQIEVFLHPEGPK